MATKNHLAGGLAAAVVVSIVAACGSASSETDPSPATLKPIPGSSVKEVQLTSQAMHRLGIATQKVRSEAVPASDQRHVDEVIPYSAVVYDTDGSTWTYVNTQPRTFVRERITINTIEGFSAVLSRGPAVGAAVVTVGAPELLGTEYEISGEQ
jgi:hypothetical protein